MTAPAKVVVDRPRRQGREMEMSVWLRSLAYQGGGVPAQTLWYYKSDGSCVVWSSETGEVSTLSTKEK